MKSKKTIALLFLTIGIWGAIGYQVYQQMFTEKVINEIPVAMVNSAPEDTTEKYVLMMNYADPFLKNISKSKNGSENPKATRVKPSSAEIPRQVAIAPWERIMYLGSVFNANRQTRVALVRINGVDYMSRLGETVENFKILVIHKDSVEVGYEAEKKFIKKK